MQLQSALREFDFLHNEEKGGPQGANLRPLVTEPRPVLIAPPSPRTPSPQPVVEFPEDEVHTSTYTQHCFACFSVYCYWKKNKCIFFSYFQCFYFNLQTIFLFLHKVIPFYIDLFIKLSDCARFCMYFFKYYINNI